MPVPWQWPDVAVHTEIGLSSDKYVYSTEMPENAMHGSSQVKNVQYKNNVVTITMLFKSLSFQY